MGIPSPDRLTRTARAVCYLRMSKYDQHERSLSVEEGDICPNCGMDTLTRRGSRVSPISSAQLVCDYCGAGYADYDTGKKLGFVLTSIRLLAVVVIAIAIFLAILSAINQLSQ